MVWGGGGKRVVSLRLRNGRFSRRRRRICSPTNEHRRLALYICLQTNKQWVALQKGAQTKQVHSAEDSPSLLPT